MNEAAKMCREMQQYIADFRVNINVSYIEWIHGYDAMFLQLQEKA